MAGSEPPVLWQFRFSHFNEKARWALDWKGVEHVRRSLVPGLHIPRVMWLTGRKSVPVLVLDGRAITDSTSIIAALEECWPDPPLYPSDPTERRRALALEDHFDEELGPYIRRALFHDLLPHSDAAVGALTMGCGPVFRGVYRSLFPLVRAAMRMDMRIDEASARLGRERTVAALDRVARELQPSGYLVGHRFGVADLTAAALLSPLVFPPEFPYQPDITMPEGITSFRASVAEHPAFRWVENMYRRHRGTSVERAA